MDKELKAKWVTALRSGKYSQGKGALLRDGLYCCLGVLCEVQGRSDDWRKWNIHPFENDQGPITFAQAMPLADMNDTGKSFPEIADYIEANL